MFICYIIVIYDYLRFYSSVIIVSCGGTDYHFTDGTSIPYNRLHKSFPHELQIPVPSQVCVFVEAYETSSYWKNTYMHDASCGGSKSVLRSLSFHIRIIVHICQKYLVKAFSLSLNLEL